jgi:2-deoxy-D-gluconate 3-dehydrogenase
MNYLDRFRLDGKRAVVTGCSRGIGRAIALALAAAGADIVGVGTNAKTLEAIGKDIRGLGRSFLAIVADLGDRKAVGAVCAEIATTGPVDILVNNAGIIRRAPAVTHSDEDWDKVIAVNLTAPFLLARDIGADMVKRKRGKIIFTASLLSFQGGLNVIGYAASKAGITAITKALSNEWAQHSVNVNAIAPGYIQTDVNIALRENPERERAITGRIPAGIWGEPADVAPAAVFLASEASAYIHGEILTVDGGWMGR